MDPEFVKPIHQRTVQRSLAMVDKGLLAVLNDLCEARSPWPLFLHGPAGTGKTCAALAFLDWCYETSYYAVGELLDAFVQAQSGRLWLGDYKFHSLDFHNHLSRRNILVLDELAIRNQTSDFAYETIKRVVDGRQGKPTIYISNLDLEEMARIYDDRVASRLASGTVFHLAGDDRRLG